MSRLGDHGARWLSSRPCCYDGDVFAIVHDTFEKGSTPVVRHVFTGDTPEKARRFYQAHRKSDAFMRECDDRGIFNGRVQCRTRTRELAVTPQQLEALHRGTLAGAPPAQLAAPEPEPCKVSFWHFAGAAAAGSAAAMGAAWLAGKAFPDNTTAQKAGKTFIRMGAFWIVAGLAWVAISHRSTE